MNARRRLGRWMLWAILALTLGACATTPGRPQGRPGRAAEPIAAGKPDISQRSVGASGASRPAQGAGSTGSVAPYDAGADTSSAEVSPTASEMDAGSSLPRETDLWERLRAGFAFVQCEPRATMQASLRAFTEHPEAFERMLENASSQLDYVARRLAEADIPAEFALLPMVESRYLMHPQRAGSRGPAGPWQLMPHTARAFGLQVEREYDARLDLIASTEAAIRLLRSLHDQFDDWVLVNLAFNAGDGRVRGAVRRAGGWHGDAYALPLNSITRAHFSRLRALVCICTASQRYGLSLPASPSVRLHALPIGAARNVAETARRLKVEIAELRTFNPILAGNAHSPLGMSAVLVPRLMNAVDSRRDPAEPASGHAQAPLAASEAVATSAAIHIVSRGDSLWLVARRYRVALDQLRRWNALNAKALLQPGQVLRVTPP